MNKRKVDNLIRAAYEVLKEVKVPDEKNIGQYIYIVNSNKVDNKWRGYISSFGAAISTGSLLSAIAFFSAKNSAALHRELLIMAIEKLLNKENLFQYIADNINDERRIKEEIIEAAVALKLAMNFYDLGKGEVENNGNQP